MRYHSLVALCSLPIAFAATLFNGSQSLILPSWTPSACLNAFSTSISCDPNLVQLLTSADDQVGWTTSQLQSLCTSGCNSSLASLRQAVVTGCGNSSFYYGLSGNVSFTNLVEMRQYKYNLACMQDTSTNKYCLDTEKSWNISALVQSGTVTWPNNTNKVYPDFSDDEGMYFTYWNGSAMPISAIVPLSIYGNANVQNNASYQGNMAGQDWYVDRSSQFYSNYGWPYALNYDEYPTQIQCSPCFLQKLQFGISSPWGMIYDEITSQVWSNIQKNCKITTTLVPANNLTGIGVSTNYTSPQYNRTLNGTSACTRYITASDPSITASAFAVQNNIALMSLLEMNNIWNTSVGSLPLCAPAACQITIVGSRQDATNFVAAQSNITLPQFLQWNPFVDPLLLLPGESVCVGPPGGTYIPRLTTAANATVYSTTAKPAAPTASGTIAYCGLYYNVSSGDYCNLISQKFGITFNQLIGMNPTIDSNCTNLYLGYDYCMAPCCNSTIPTVMSTAKATTAPTSSSMGTTATTTSTYVSAPGPTQSGASSKCYKWYLVQSGDYCYAIEQTYGITQAQFLYWNPEVDSNCDIYSGYAYCVNGPAMPSSSSSTSAVSTSKAKS